MTDTKEFDVSGLADKPILASGSGGPAVHLLCDALAELGYETSTSKGENPYGIVDGSVMSAVQQFRSAEGVEEEPEAFGSKENADAHIGPATWRALLDATGAEPGPPVSASSSVPEPPATPKKKSASSSGSGKKKSSAGKSSRSSSSRKSSAAKKKS